MPNQARPGISGRGQRPQPPEVIPTTRATAPSNPRRCRNKSGAHAEGQDRRLVIPTASWADVGVAGPLRLETGVSWTEKGAEGTVQGFEEPIATHVRLRYLQLPLQLRLDVLSTAALRPSLAVGPAVSVEVGCAYEQDPSNVAVVLGCRDPDRTRTDWGLIFGGGLAFDTGRAIILFDARYDAGLRDLDTIDQLRTRNRTFSMSTGFAIPIGR